MPNRNRRKAQLDIDFKIDVICQKLIDENRNITARSVSALAEIATSSITRDSIRCEILNISREKQNNLRAWQKRQSKSSRKSDSELLVKKDQKISDLEKQVHYLQTSHKAMILAVGELGGMDAYRKFFKKWNVSKIN